MATRLAPNGYLFGKLRLLLSAWSSTYGVLIRPLKHLSYNLIQVGNENGRSDPEFVREGGEDKLKEDSGAWIDQNVWHGKPLDWDRFKWIVQQVRLLLA